MASLNPKFHEETVGIHQEHEELLAQLDQLDAALEQMACYADVFTDLATANQAVRSGKWMAEWLPRHYAREETTVLETIARMSPELASFARGMKRQHNEMRVRLESFRDRIEHLTRTSDLENAVNQLKQDGTDLTRMMRLHMAAEEKKFADVEN
ncbi:MAG: hemerythrin domain-containing protein [Candidatus Korobacteraceae bacterium]